ncbi:MAG: hypothetical protein ABIN01_15155 [Ferruginibacter sp.]
MDELKRFLRKHEASMEVDVPDEKGIWQRIEAADKKTKQRRNPLVLFTRYAAAACFILAIGFGLIRLTKNDMKPANLPVIVKKNLPVNRDTLRSAINQVVTVTAAKEKSKPVIKSQPEKETLKVEDGYQQLVSYQLKRLRTTPIYTESPGYFIDFKLQLQQMDKDEASLRNDMKVYGFNDQLLESLINIYQQKLNLLKSMQGEINKMNNRVKEKQSNEQLSSYYLDI